jgi:hypothetical protein
MFAGLSPHWLIPAFVFGLPCLCFSVLSCFLPAIKWTMESVVSRPGLGKY